MRQRGAYSGSASRKPSWSVPRACGWGARLAAESKESRDAEEQRGSPAWSVRACRSRARVLHRRPPPSPAKKTRSAGRQPWAPFRRLRGQSPTTARAGMSDAAVRAKTAGFGASGSRRSMPTAPRCCLTGRLRACSRRSTTCHRGGRRWSPWVTSASRGLREVGQRRGGQRAGTYDANKSRTFPGSRRRALLAPVATRGLVRAGFPAWTWWSARATPSRSLRLTWQDGTKLELMFFPKGRSGYYRCRSSTTICPTKCGGRRVQEGLARTARRARGGTAARRRVASRFDSASRVRPRGRAPRALAFFASPHRVPLAPQSSGALVTFDSGDPHEDGTNYRRHHVAAPSSPARRFRCAEVVSPRVGADADALRHVAAPPDRG